MLVDHGLQGRRGLSGRFFLLLLLLGLLLGLPIRTIGVVLSCSFSTCMRGRLPWHEDELNLFGSEDRGDEIVQRIGACEPDPHSRGREPRKLAENLLVSVRDLPNCDLLEILPALCVQCSEELLDYELVSGKGHNPSYLAGSTSALEGVLESHLRVSVSWRLDVLLIHPHKAVSFRFPEDLMLDATNLRFTCGQLMPMQVAQATHLHGEDLVDQRMRWLQHIGELQTYVGLLENLQPRLNLWGGKGVLLDLVVGFRRAILEVLQDEAHRLVM